MGWRIHGDASSLLVRSLIVIAPLLFLIFVADRIYYRSALREEPVALQNPVELTATRVCHAGSRAPKPGRSVTAGTFCTHRFVRPARW
jgi:hypothetical protein